MFGCLFHVILLLLLLLLLLLFLLVTERSIICGAICTFQAQRGLIPSDVQGHCTECRKKVPRVPNPKELAELAEDMRGRIIRAEKTSYWKQYGEGMLDREAVVALNNLADTVTDTPFR